MNGSSRDGYSCEWEAVKQLGRFYGWIGLELRAPYARNKYMD
jgi:hypothetical protein